MTGIETGKTSKRFFAVTSLGRSRWYWVVWPSLAALQTSKAPLLHVGDGYEKTKAQAVEKALELAGRNGEWIAGKYARAYHQSTKMNTTPTGDRHGSMQPAAMPALHEFLYRDIYDAATRQWKSTPHRIVRKTAKYVYVEQSPYSPQVSTGSWLDGEPST